MDDVIFIDGLQVQALIGVYDFERDATQPLVFDVEMTVDTRSAGSSDALADTVDYAVIAQTIEAICTQSGFALVEALADTIATQLLRDFPIQQLSLRVTKPQAVPAARGVGVRIVRRKESA
ncbi:dihydroneopterin aldolase [Pseudoxanthomonas sp. GM95]|uniref:dihydroneopterin aldolase n=1 Tax=Pseudoxanthomonas sp. GM95 TaxID=1881043 RepID=UPI0008BBBB6B|nr:dihydroneopterin aldolase [Pseudoxanthomonas sp. GM95]SEM38714.1 dihydroneopterin aldolase [Pseudoxanthomonas sp. GM95]